MRETTNVGRLGTEKIWKLLLEMSSQTTFSLLVYAVLSVTDTYFLSVGINSLAAAGSSIISPVLIALGGVATIVGAGGASVVSRALGEHNTARASRTVANTYVIFLTVAVLISIFGTIFIRPLVFLLGATESIAPYAIEYGRIIFLGAVTATGYSAIVRADGSARYSTVMWVVPITVNAILCWLFIMVLHIGAAGAALATVSGQAISVSMSIYFFFFKKNRSYQIQPEYFIPDRAIVTEVLMIGMPSFLKSLGASLFVIITNNLLRLIGGDSALGIFAITSKVYSSLSMPQTGIVQGMQPLVGFNFGQRRFSRVRSIIQLSIRVVIIYGLFILGLCVLMPSALIALLSHEPGIIAEGQHALRLLALSYPFGGVALMVAAYFQSIGKPREAFVLTLGGILLVKLPVLLLASKLFGLNGIWASEAVSELILCTVALLMLRRYLHTMPAEGEPVPVSAPVLAE